MLKGTDRIIDRIDFKDDLTQSYKAPTEIEWRDIELLLDENNVRNEELEDFYFAIKRVHDNKQFPPYRRFCDALDLLVRDEINVSATLHPLLIKTSNWTIENIIKRIKKFDERFMQDDFNISEPENLKEIDFKHVWDSLYSSYHKLKDKGLDDERIWQALEPIKSEVLQGRSIYKFADDFGGERFNRPVPFSKAVPMEKVSQIQHD